MPPEPLDPRLMRSAEEILRELDERIEKEMPQWRGRGVEDPARVILETFALALAGMRARIESLPSVLFEMLAEHLGVEALWPIPSRAAVVLVPASDLDAAVHLRPGTGVTSSRRSPSGERPCFTTAAPTWLSPVRLECAVAADGGRLVEIPVFQPHAAGRAGAGDIESGFELFRDAVLDRHLYLADPAFLALREGTGEVVLEWPGAPAWIADLRWEYSVPGGWRRLQVEFREARAPGGGRTLRATLTGPLPDFENRTLGGRSGWWLRIALPAKRVRVSPPRLAWAPEVRAEGAEEAPPPPRPPARLLSGSPQRLRDHSLAGGGRIDIPALDTEEGPAVWLGFDRPLSFSLYWHVVGPEPPRGFPEPEFDWEYSGAKGFKTLVVADATGGFARGGTIACEAPGDWAPQERFGRRLYWVRARWRAGAYAETPRVGGILAGGVEVREGRIAQGIAARVRFDRRSVRGRLEVQVAADFEPFDDLEVFLQGDWVRWRRVEGEGRLRRGEFRLHRKPRSLEIEAAHALEGDFEARIPELRLEVEGAALARETLNVLETDLEGLAAVRQPLEGRCGRPGETAAGLLGRLREEWPLGGRAVTASDYRAIVRAADPGIERVDVLSNRSRPGEILVVVFPRKKDQLPPAASPPPLSPARLEWLEEYLQHRAPLGMRVRVVEAIRVPYELRLHQSDIPRLRPEELEDLRREVERYLDPLEGGPRGEGCRLGGDLRPEAIESILCGWAETLGVGRPPRFALRRLAAEGRELPDWSLPRIVRVSLAGEGEGGKGPIEAEPRR